jgi:hypothetical protein
LIFVDLSGLPGSPPPAGEKLPAWLPDAAVFRRGRWSTTCNWKVALQFLKASPQLFFDDVEECDDWRAFGPLSLMLVQRKRAALLHVMPKFVGQTDLQLVEMAAPDELPEMAAVDDRIADGLRGAEGDAPECLDRPFFAWYWSMMAAV